MKYSTLAFLMPNTTEKFITCVSKWITVIKPLILEYGIYPTPFLLECLLEQEITTKFQLIIILCIFDLVCENQVNEETELSYLVKCEIKKIKWIPRCMPKYTKHIDTLLYYLSLGLHLVRLV